MSTSAIRLSVVMPAYNEEEGIAVAVEAVQQQVLDRVNAAELVVVNDGSRDSTGALLDQMAARDSRIRVVHKANGGHGPALISGMAAARGEYIFLIDSDNQIPMEDFAALWQQVADANLADANLADGHLAAFGVRRIRHDATLRRLLTVLIRVSLFLLFGVRLYDANVPFKVFHRRLWDAARAHIPDDTLAPSLFFAIYTARRRERIAFVNVHHKDRETGTVSIKRWKLVRFCARAFRQLLDFRSSLRTA
ncbi:MAG: glycosyltransferase family 2 protein [Gemmatimonadaceae bacterium]